MADYPNLEAILDGRVSGHATEWPLIRAELAALFAKLAAAETRLECRAPDGTLLPQSCDGIACRDETIRLLDERLATAEREIDAAMKDAERWRAYREYRAMPDRDMPKHWQAFRTWGIEAGNDDYSVSQGALDAAIDDAIAGKGAA